MIPDPLCFQQIAASMGPLSEESGDLSIACMVASIAADASMGPLSEESGDPCRRAAMGSLVAGFNGAALRRERRRGNQTRRNPPPNRASMGPLSEESGDCSASMGQ